MARPEPVKGVLPRQVLCGRLEPGPSGTTGAMWWGEPPGNHLLAVLESAWGQRFSHIAGKASGPREGPQVGRGQARGLLLQG